MTNSDYNNQAQIDHILSEFRQSMVRTFSNFIFDVATKEYLDLTGKISWGAKTDLEITKQVILKMDSIYRKNIITNGRICSDILDHSLRFNYNKPSNNSQRSFMTELGDLGFSSGSSNFFTDSSMRYDSNYIIMYDNALIDWDVKRVLVNNHYGSVSPQAYVDIDEHMLVVNPVVLYVFTDENRGGYDKYISERREQKINTLLDEDKRLG